MNFYPDSVVYLLKGVPLTLGEPHQIDFKTESEQAHYFISRADERFMFDKLTYQRAERQFVAVPVNAEKLFNINYLMFKNKNFSGKWFYAYVTRVEYRSPDMSWVYFEIDSFQTWLFDFHFKQSFIEREHCDRWYPDGSPVINTIDEGLNYGTEYQCVQSDTYKPFGDTAFILVASKDPLEDPQHYKPWTPNLSNVPQSLYWYLFPFCTTLNRSYRMLLGDVLVTLVAFNEFANAIREDKDLVGKVVSMSVVDYCPIVKSITSDYNIIMQNTDCFDLENLKNHKLSGDLICLRGSSVPQIVKNFGNKYNGFPKYKESKMLMYPYSYTVITDLKGHQFDIKNEYISTKDLSVEMLGSLDADTKTAYVVQNYRGMSNILNGMINDDTNSLAVVDDYTAVYLQGKSNTIRNNLAWGFANDTFSGVTGLMTNNLAMTGSAGLSAFERITTHNAKMKDIDNMPSNMRQQGNNTNFSFGNGIFGLKILKYTVTPEYQEILEDYFNMYGYKTMRTKTPNLRTRQYWNYVKTVSANIVGDMPQDDLAKIRDMFDAGLTLWHSPSVFGRYDLDNKEV